MASITNLFSRIFSSDGDNQKPSKARIFTEEQHGILQKHISRSALKVLNQLHDAKYDAHLVGGGVRDLLLGLRPKDFDIATNATPEQVRKLFRNSRIIGRRFRLVHVVFGREIIEVATFRANQTDIDKIKSSNSNNTKSRQCPESGMITRDNIFGRIDEDAVRRDFTVNALYYNIADRSVIDFLGGMEDLNNRNMNIIGDATTRYREDPVRMLRAVRLSTKLGLKIAPKTLEPISKLATLLEPISNARLWDESLKLFLHGHAQKTWHHLIETRLAHVLFPQTMQSLHDDKTHEFRHFIEQALGSTDQRIFQRKPVTPAFLFAVWLWQPLQDAQQKLITQGVPVGESFNKAASKVLRISHNRIGMPKRFSVAVREIWQQQNQLPKRVGKWAERNMENPRFRASYDFLQLRAMPDSKEEKLAEWWTEYQIANAEQRLEMVKLVKRSHHKVARRSYKPKKIKK